MKKKLTQLLMLLTVAVGMGVTVSSCKDTNEDVLNKWREESIKENASLTDAFNQRIQELQSQLDLYQQALEEINKTGCCCGEEGGLSSIVEGLKGDINIINAQIINLGKGLDADGNKTEEGKKLEEVSSSVTNITNIINNIDGQGTNLTMFISNIQTAQSTMEEEIQKLKDALSKIKGCEQDCAAMATSLAALELRMSESEQKIKDAMDLATAANTAAGEAKLTAAQAQAAADAAKQIADAAQTAADQAKADAGIAKADAAKAQETADAAKQLAEGLQTLLGEKMAEINGKIQSIETRLSQLDTKTQEAWDKATAAASKAETNANAIETINGNITTINTQIGGLSQSITTLTTNYDELKEKLTGLDTKLDEKVKDLTDKIEAVDTKVEGLSTKFDELSEELKDVKEKLDQVEQDCKDNLAAARAEITEQIAVAIANLATKDDIANMATKDDLTDLATKEALNEKYEELKALIEKCKCTDWSATIKDIQDVLEKLDKDKADKADVDQAIADLKDELTKQITDDIEVAIDEIKEQLKDKASAEELKALEDRVKALEADPITKTSVEEMIDLAVSTLEDADKLTNERIDKLAEDLKAIQESYVTAEAWKAENSRLQGLIDANTTTIGEMKESISEINETIESIQEDMSALESRISAAEVELATALADIETLKDDVAAIQEALAKQVTGIIIQGANMPNGGSFSAPFGITTNILMAYYGKPTDDVEFPTSSTANYVRPDEALTDADMEMIGWDGIFESRANKPLTYEKGYAGKIYMTINPNTVDVNGLKLDIVNSVDEVSFIKLDGLKKSDKKLQFGFSRADNGFYEAEARVPNLGDLDKINRPVIETAALKEAVSEIINKRQNASLSVIAEDMYKVIASARFDRSGLKCAYTENGNEHAVYSEYNLAATAMQPLSLAAYKDLNVKTIPGVERAENLVDRISKRLKDTIHKGTKQITGSTLAKMMADLKIKNIEVKDLSEDKLAKFVVQLDTTITISGLSYHLTSLENVSVPIKFDFDDKAHVKFDGDATLLIQDGSVIKTPVVNLSPDLKAEGGSGKILIPLKDAEGNFVYNSNHEQQFLEYDLSNIEFDYSNVTTDSHGNKVVELKVEGNTVGHITYEDDVDIKFQVDTKLENVTINVDKWFYFGDNGTDTKSINLWMSYDMRDAAKDLWGEAQNALGNVNDMLEDIRKIVKEANKLIDKVNDYEDRIDSNIDSYAEKIKNYIEKINTQITSLINSANSRLQPVLIASTGKGIKRLSGAKNYPTVLSADVTLYPTSWTMELITPFARKHVAVTNVFKGSESAKGGNAACKAALNAVNKGEMNKVIDGSSLRITASGLQPGFVYEIAYSALDFQGKIATRKYYVSVE